MCDNRIRYARAGNILAYIVILAVLGILGIIEGETQTACRSIGQLEEDGLCVIAHVMSHVVGVGREVEHLDGVRVRSNIRAHELTLETQSVDRPSAPLESENVGQGIVLLVGRFESGEFELVDIECTVQAQVIGRPDSDRGKDLGVLVLRTETFGEQVVERLVERYRNEVCRLHVTLGIDDGVTDGEMDVLDGLEREHVSRHELVHGTVMGARLTFGIILVVIIRGIRHVAHEPSMEIIELEPRARSELQGNHRYGRIMCREDG